MVRIPDAGRFELRLMDGAANPYLLQAGVLAAGLDGLANRRDPGERLDINMYTDGHKLENVRKLPLNLLDAIRLTDRSEVLRARLGDSFVDSYVKMKNEEWLSYMRHLSPWETANTLDC
jgi:glutamine synthetase